MQYNTEEINHYIYGQLIFNRWQDNSNEKEQSFQQMFIE